MIQFIIGMLVGILGLFLICCLVIAGDSDDR